MNTCICIYRGVRFICIPLRRWIGRVKLWRRWGRGWAKWRYILVHMYQYMYKHIYKYVYMNWKSQAMKGMRERLSKVKVYMYVHTYVNVCIYIKWWEIDEVKWRYVCIYTYMYVCLYLYNEGDEKQVKPSKGMYIYTCMNIWTYIYYKCIYVYVYR
jgi:hypothetical protein